MDVTRAHLDEATLARLDLVHVACGDDASDPRFQRLLEGCMRAGKPVGVLVDVDSRGRPLPLWALGDVVEEVRQRCTTVASAARARGLTVAHAKPAGLLEQAVNRSTVLAEAFARGVTQALGAGATILGRAGSALAHAATAAGASFAREGYADRAARADGVTLPLDAVQAFFADPHVARARACSLVAAGDIDVIALHDRCPIAVATTQAVREELDLLRTIELTQLRLEPELALGDSALRLFLPHGLRADAAPAPTGRSIPPSPIPVSIDRRRVLDALRAHPGVVDANLTETRACVYFDPGSPPLGPWDITATLLPQKGGVRQYVVPIWYDGEDLEVVASHAGLSARDAVELHTSSRYLVTMIGAFPGFAYLRGIDARLVLPRRHTPRLFNPKNIVGIAAGYTGIFPFASPNGWNLIGTARDFVGFTSDNGSCFQIGDVVKFEAVTST
jgi:UPF0271 protein